MDVARYKHALLTKRSEITDAGAGAKPVQTTEGTSSRQGDLADQATGNNEVHIQLKLKQTDAKILQAKQRFFVGRPRSDCSDDLSGRLKIRPVGQWES